MNSTPKISKWIIGDRESVSPNQKIGILGGSFNPAHEGHLSISKIALQRLNLDEVWWIISPRNPLKKYDILYDFEDRVSSAEKAIDTKHISISRLEKNAQIKYTIGTIEYLNTRYVGTKFVWIMGADNLKDFHRWREWDKLAITVPIAIIDRPSSSLDVTSSLFANKYRKYRVDEADAQNLADKKKPAWVFLHSKLNDQSSSQLRKSGLK